jgi:hypothetical protein
MPLFIYSFIYLVISMFSLTLLIYIPPVLFQTPTGALKRLRKYEDYDIYLVIEYKLIHGYQIFGGA